MTLGHTETGVQHRTHTPPKKQHEGTPIYVCVCVCDFFKLQR